jgi:peroxiredoxin
VLTTRQFAARYPDFQQRGVEIVKTFRSPVDALRLHVTGPHALPYVLLGDPDRAVYRLFGVDVSWRALLTFRGFFRIRMARLKGARPRLSDMLRDGIGGSPADFLVGRDGRLLRVHYGVHLADSVTPDEALAWIDSAIGGGAPR